MRAEICERPVSESIELAGRGVGFDLLIPARNLKLLEPCRKAFECKAHSNQRKPIDIHQAHVRDLQVRDDGQRQEGDLQEGFLERRAECVGRFPEVV